MKLSGKILGCMILGALWCGLVHSVVAAQQDFDSFPPNTPLNNVPGWQAAPDHIIRKTSLISILPGGTTYPNVGYTNQGVEAYIQDSQFPTNALQEGALWTLPSTNSLTQNGGLFQVNVRLSNWTNNTVSVVNDAFANGFWMLVGSGMQYQTNNLTGEQWVVWTNSSAFGICFVEDDSGNRKVYWDEVAGFWGHDDANNGAPGWGMSSATTSNWNRRIVVNWNRDTYYTVQLSNILFNSLITTGATAVLSIFETANPANVITNNILVRANGGSQFLQTAPFTSINQVALAVGRRGGLDHYDHVMLLQPPSAIVNTTVLQITSIARQGNDINLTWMTGTAGGQTNAVQVTSGDANGNYNTNNFANIATLVIPGSGIVVTNYIDVGGATNKPNRYYRVRLVP